MAAGQLKRAVASLKVCDFNLKISKPFPVQTLETAFYWAGCVPA